MKITIDPNVGSKIQEFKDFCNILSSSLSNLDEDELIIFLLSESRKIIPTIKKNLSNDELAFITSQSILLDILAQGWTLSVKQNCIQLTYNFTNHLSIDDEKSRIRRGHLYQRNRQLTEKSVSDFINKCERKKNINQGWHSIFSLMRDGSELYEQLIELNYFQEEVIQIENAKKIINPYIQFAERGVVDRYTGLPLLDIWRYFRHTWITPYKVLPGRSIAILIRDAAAPNHPVIGIAALGSSVAQFTKRDSWIGWEAQVFVENLIRNPSNELGCYLLSKLDSILNEIYKKDLIKTGILNDQIISNPSKELIQKLRELSLREIESHRKENKDIFNRLKHNESINDSDWELYANTSLYKSKRYKTLSILLDIRRYFQQFGFVEGSKSELNNALKYPLFQKALGQLIRKIKAENVGIKMLDIIICGAIPPYSSILGGKLICSLLFSPEIVKYYKNKYSKTVSIIASSMCGKKIIRDQNLVLLNTTSLYGIGSSQYNRIKIPVSEIGIKSNDLLEYKNLGHSKGFGSFQFSKQTIDLIHHVLGRKGGGRIVNSIFGEGANPLLRKLREGLDLLGFPSVVLLNHGNQRILYGITLAKNFREVLLGTHKKPKYLIPQKNSKMQTELLSDFWIKRWLIKRIKNEEVLEFVKKQSLDYPITHGARVHRPQLELSIFD